MQFEHSLTVTDSDRGFTPTREDVWSALLRRVREPALFNPAITGVRIVASEPQRVSRELKYGPSSIADVVSVDEHARELCFAVPQTNAHAGGELRIRVIEDPGAIALRFSYGTTLKPESDTTGVDPSEFVKAAYAASDRDTVRAVRRLLGCVDS